MTIYSTLIVEFLLISIAILLLFKLRSKLGLAPLYILLGSTQYMQANLGATVGFKFFDFFKIYPGSVILFSAVLFAVLLIYIKEGVTSARTLIIGIIISIFIMAGLFEITHAQELINRKIQHIDSNTLSIFQINYKVFIFGTLILLLDFFLLIIVYQFLISKIKKSYFFFILLLSLFIVLIFDSVLFNVTLFYKSAGLKYSLISHVIGKSIAAILFASILYLYLKFGEKKSIKATFIANQRRGVFSILSYRGKIKHLETEKREMEKKMVSTIETTLNKISDGFISLDANWCYTYANEKAGEYLGKNSSSLIGKNIWTVFPKSVDPFYDIYTKAIETQEKYYFEEYYEPLGKWFENRVYPSQDGLAIYFTDVTEQKKAELALKESENRIQTILDTEPECVKQVSADGKLLYMNPAGLAMIEADNFEIVKGKSMVNLVLPAYQDAFKTLTKDVFNGHSGHLEFEIKGLKGTIRWLETHAVPLKDNDGHIISLLGITRDVTKQKQDHLAIIESEEKYRTLAENSIDALFIVSDKLKIEFVNKRATEMFGHSFNGFMGLSVQDILVSDLKDLAKDGERINSEKSVIVEREMKRKDGSVFPADVNRITLENGKYMAFVRDISERKKAQDLLIKSERYLDNIINNIGDPVFVKDHQSRIILVNDAFCSFFNLCNEEVIGKTLAEDLPVEEIEIFLKNDNQVLSTGIENINEETISFKNEEKKIISTKKTRFIDDDGNKFLIATIRDITQRKNAELELEKHKNNLEELVKIRTDELEKEKIKAQSADLMKSAFLATMSHELRTPMNSIIGFTSILLKEFAGPLNEEQAKQIGMVKNSGQHLLGLINDILDISKIEAGQLKVSLYPFNYVVSLQKTVDFLLPQALKKGLDIESEISKIDIILKSDERRVEQILLNLISNAIKFSNKGIIRVKVDVKDHLIITQIIDQGIGIHKKNLNKLFMPFIQLEGGLNRSHEGTGLGLAISKNLITKLGGTIRVQSTLGKGSTFTFTLPLD